MQSEQPLMPVPDWYVPGTQSKQSALLDTPELVWYFPDPQAKHLIDPWLLWYVPMLQGLQFSLSGLPKPV